MTVNSAVCLLPGLGPLRPLLPWRGVEPKERVIKQALYRELGDKDEVERVFLIIKAQREY